MRRIYFDLDGVAAVWSWVGPDVWMEQEGYYANRPIDTAIADAMSILSEDDDVELFIASKYVLERHKNEKETFVDKLVDKNGNKIFDKNHRLFIPYESDKSSVVDFAGAVLVDDWNNNLFDCEKQGGVAVKYLNGENNGSGEWKGFTVCHTSSGSAIAATLKAFAREAA